MAESCTAGLAAAKLGIIPGISNFFCGSMVVYQSRSKIEWLKLDPIALSNPDCGPVSMWASRALVTAILESTPHADFSAAITGHLGPNAPPNLDGHIYCAIMSRQNRSYEQSFRLRAVAPKHAADCELRQIRQDEAANRFLDWIDEMLSKFV